MKAGSGIDPYTTWVDQGSYGTEQAATVDPNVAGNYKSNMVDENWNRFSKVYIPGLHLHQLQYNKKVLKVDDLQKMLSFP